MKKLFIALFAVSIQPSAFAIDYGDDGYEFFYVTAEKCSGIDGNNQPVQAQLERQYVKYVDKYPTHSWRWVVQAGSDKWEISAYDKIYDSYANKLTVLSHPEVYYAGVSKYEANRNGNEVNLAGVFKPYDSKKWKPVSFDFRLTCKSL